MLHAQKKGKSFPLMSLQCLNGTVSDNLLNFAICILFCGIAVDEAAVNRNNTAEAEKEILWHLYAVKNGS
jgi:hypothetical protein